MLDIHSHRNYPSSNAEGESGCVVVSLSVGDDTDVFSYVSKEKEGLFSVGLHPWQVDAHWREKVERILRPALALSQVVAVGEVGLDRLSGGDMQHQQEAFEAQVLLAEEYGKPLIVHCVRSYDLLLGLHRRLHPEVPWIVHGFRGKPELASQLLHRGIYLSFGEHYHEEALRICPSDSFFIETDDSGVDVGDLYFRAASLRGVPVEALVQQVKRNFSRLFSLVI